jgi:hypothetical protein
VELIRLETLPGCQYTAVDLRRDSRAASRILRMLSAAFVKLRLGSASYAGMFAK